MLSSKNELDTHHIWYVVTWVARSSPCFLSDLGISAGILTGRTDQVGWCCMGLFVRLDKSGRSSVAKKGNYVSINIF